MVLNDGWEGEKYFIIHESGDLPKAFSIDLTGDKGYTQNNCA